MGIFRKNDELFEIMSRGRRKPAPAAPAPSGKEPRGPISERVSRSSAIIRRPSLNSTGAHRMSTSSGFGPRRAFGSDEPELLEIDGDALIVVEDGWTFEEEEKGTKAFAIRSDTLAVGACLIGGLLVASFLLGRTSITPDQPQLSVQIGGAEAPPEAPAPRSPVAAMLPSAVVGSPVAGSFRPTEATSTPASAQGTPTSVAASAPQPRSEAPASPERTPAKGKYVLVVCTTTPENAKKLAKWLNTAPRSPIFGRAGLEGFATRKGVVRIRGFQQREQDVLGQVKATGDPLGGNGTFHTAYYKRA